MDINEMLKSRKGRNVVRLAAYFAARPEIENLFVKDINIAFEYKYVKYLLSANDADGFSLMVYNKNDDLLDTWSHVINPAGFILNKGIV